ncbi:actinia tenebrosa protease inhibitors-like isoform X2 [Argopecten irradians]|uniref:actinia tenebrosa protease inhibitors-like isoform X2 n=1 Tax=Argopecten irradians TaxID=31199 RepID=UPI0037226C46
MEDLYCHTKLIFPQRRQQNQHLPQKRLQRILLDVIMGLTEKQQLHRTLTGKQQLHRTLTGKQQPHRIMMINQQIPTNPEAVISTQVKVALVCPSQTMSSQDQIGDVCQQPTVSGSCMAYFRRFTYDAVTKSCKEFIYGGCEGNDNRFDTLEQCQTRCQGKLSDGTKIPPIEHYNSPGQAGKGDCYLPPETGPCRGFFRKYFYNASSNSCEQFTYGGCGGNGNRFNTYKECEAMCGDAVEADVCDKPLVTGPCRASFPKFGYDTASKACREFLYGGCHGNDNQFDSMQQCENRCIPKTESCEVVSCVIPIVVVIALVIVAVIIAIVLVKKRQQSSKKYAPTSATEPDDPSEMKKMAPEPENV